MNMQRDSECMKADQGTITLLAESRCCVALHHIISWCRKAHCWNTNPLGYNLCWLFFCVTASFSVSSQLVCMWWSPDGYISWLQLRNVCIFVTSVAAGHCESATLCNSDRIFQTVLLSERSCSDPLTTGCLVFSLSHRYYGSHIK